MAWQWFLIITVFVFMYRKIQRLKTIAEVNNEDVNENSAKTKYRIVGNVFEDMGKKA